MAKTGPLARPATILVAEDSADTRTVLRRALSSYGYYVIEAADGREAVEMPASSSILSLTTAFGIRTSAGVVVGRAEGVADLPLRELREQPRDPEQPYRTDSTYSHLSGQYFTQAV